MDAAHDLLGTLRRYWGYESFRPRQEQVIQSLLAGHDVVAIMPTGGGKSLCYQLPAVLHGRHTAIVVSPLIALMQDQVAHLDRMGVPSAYLNSTLASAEQARIMREAEAGAYRLLYLSPERLARSETLAWLARVPVAFFAIDEAHCISEWGHEFRPDYRQLQALRHHFPDHPIAAFTASATQRVRHDILEQLHLHEPHRYVLSFHRPNLRYLVQPCDAAKQERLLLAALAAHRGKNVIVYAPTIARVHETVEFLETAGTAAIPYHGQMDAADRRRNQERWMADEVPVLVGTLAFGLGINKLSVRAVIHLALTKSVEQYYQEAGRAGRDGEPADCLLLWQKRDLGLLAHFSERIQDTTERERAWQRYHEIKGFAETRVCRHLQVCRHFGEKPRWSQCGSCDVCGALPEWLATAVQEPARTRAGNVRLSARAITPADETAKLLSEGRTFEEIAALRGRARSTVVNMVAELVEQGRVPFQDAWVPEERRRAIEAAVQQHGAEKLAPLKQALPPECSYDEIRLCVARWRAAA